MGTADGVVWKCTNNMRFVERDVIVSHAQRIVKTVKVLQQYWEPLGARVVKVNEDGSQLYSYEGEWRDVPLEKEETK